MVERLPNLFIGTRLKFLMAEFDNLPIINDCCNLNPSKIALLCLKTTEKLVLMEEFFARFCLFYKLFKVRFLVKRNHVIYFN